MTKHIRLRCLIHGRLETTKPTHLMVNGTLGCGLCARESQATGNRLGEQALRDELEPTLPSHIRYLGSYFDLSHRCTKIRIECASHGKRDVRPAYLRRSSHKCPDCGNENVGQGAYRLRRLLDTGEDGRPTWVVIGEVEVFGIRSVKVGITSRTLLARYSWYLKKTFFSARLREIDALVIENRVHRTFVRHKDPRILKAGMRNGNRWSGDTECYWPKRRREIEAFVREFVEILPVQKPDYWAEYEMFETPQWGMIDTSREKGLTNLPRPVVCLDTGVRYASISEASRALSLSNIPSVLAGNRRLAGGFRWAYAEEVEANAQEQLRAKQYSTRRVLCVETGEVFASLTEAAKAKGISSSHITSVCKGLLEPCHEFRLLLVDTSDTSRSVFALGAPAALVAQVVHRPHTESGPMSPTDEVNLGVLLLAEPRRRWPIVEPVGPMNFLRRSNPLFVITLAPAQCCFRRITRCRRGQLAKIVRRDAPSTSDNSASCRLSR